MGLVENAAENIQGKKQFAKFRMLQIEEGKHVYYVYTFVTLTFRTEVILVFTNSTRYSRILIGSRL